MLDQNILNSLFKSSTDKIKPQNSTTKIKPSKKSQSLFKDENSTENSLPEVITLDELKAKIECKDFTEINKIQHLPFADGVCGVSTNYNIIFGDSKFVTTERVTRQKHIKSKFSTMMEDTSYDKETPYLERGGYSRLKYYDALKSFASLLLFYNDVRLSNGGQSNILFYRNGVLRGRKDLLNDVIKYLKINERKAKQHVES